MKVNKYRTNTCGELTINDLGKNVVLSGFVQTIKTVIIPKNKGTNNCHIRGTTQFIIFL